MLFWWLFHKPRASDGTHALPIPYPDVFPPRVYFILGRRFFSFAPPALSLVFSGGLLRAA